MAKGADLSSEIEEHGDILLFEFTDSYYTLSKKMTAIYGWILSLHSSVQKIVVVNDDTIVNVENLERVRVSLPDQD